MKYTIILAALALAGCNELRSEEALAREQENITQAASPADNDVPAPESPIGQQIAADEQAEEDKEQAERDKEVISEKEFEDNDEYLYTSYIRDNRTKCEWLIVQQSDRENIVVPRNIRVNGRTEQFCGQTAIPDLPAKTRKQWREEGRDDLANQ